MNNMTQYLLIIALILALVYFILQNQQTKKQLAAKSQQLTNFQQEVGNARKLFWQLRIAVGEWTRFKEPKEVKELVESLRKNPIFEEQIINHD